MTDPREFNRLGDLRSANIARQKEWDAGNQLTLAYRGNELAGEVGEACNVIKKLERERLGIAGSRDTVAHLAEELADVVICADLIAMHEGIDLLGEAVPAKFNVTSEKVGLKTRYEPAKAGNAVLLREVLDKIEAKIAQLKHYRDNDCQLDHARTIADGRIQQAEMDAGWLREALSTAQPDTAAQGGKQSDNISVQGAESASGAHVADRTGGANPPTESMYGDYTPVTVRASTSPSDPAPAEPAAWRTRLTVDGYEPSDWSYHNSNPLRRPRYEYQPLYTRPPRSVDVEAIKRAMGCLRIKGPCGLSTDIDDASVDEAARSIAAMIEGLPSDPIAPAAPVSVDEVAECIYYADPYPDLGGPLNWCHLSSSIKEKHRRQARALRDAFKMERK